jgi:osmotically inducible protein OsmC
MPVRSAEAVWEGDLKQGKGTMKLAGGAYEGPYSFSSRFENQSGTNPEELLAAAHAGCFSMALTAALTKAGHPPTRVHTTAKVHLDQMMAGFQIGKVELSTEANVPGIADADFQQHAENAKVTCPVSKLFASAEIKLQAKLAQ